MTEATVWKSPWLYGKRFVYYSQNMCYRNRDHCKTFPESNSWQVSFPSPPQPINIDTCGNQHRNNTLHLTFQHQWLHPQMVLWIYPLNHPHLAGLLAAAQHLLLTLLPCLHKILQVPFLHQASLIPGGCRSPLVVAEILLALHTPLLWTGSSNKHLVYFFKAMPQTWLCEISPERGQHHSKMTPTPGEGKLTTQTSFIEAEKGD